MQRQIYHCSNHDHEGPLAYSRIVDDNSPDGLVDRYMVETCPQCILEEQERIVNNIVAMLTALRE